MSFDAASSEPEKSASSDTASAPLEEKAGERRRFRPWKRLIVVLAGVVAVTVIALLALTPKKEPVRVWFVGYTNDMGQKRLVFGGSNSLPRQIGFSVCVFTGEIHHAKAPADLEPYNDWVVGGRTEEGSFPFTLYVPPKGVPYYVAWALYQTPPSTTRWWRFRMGCGRFFARHGMPRLARRVAPKPDTHYIPSTEIKE